MTQPYREHLPRTREVEVRVRKWAVRKPFSREQVTLDLFLVSLWSIIAVLDVVQIALSCRFFYLWMLVMHLVCAAIWAGSLWVKIERRIVTETKQITE